MISIIYKIAKKMALFFERAYLKSKLTFKNKESEKSCIIGENVKIYNPNEMCVYMLMLLFGEMAKLN